MATANSRGLSLSFQTVSHGSHSDQSTRRLGADEIALAALTAADKAVVLQQLVTTAVQTIQGSPQTLVDVRFDGWVDALDRFRTREDELNAHRYRSHEDVICCVASRLCNFCPPGTQFFVIGVIDVAPTRNVFAALRNRNTFYEESDLLKLLLPFGPCCHYLPHRNNENLGRKEVFVLCKISRRY